MTYSELATFAGVPRAVRAVASAVARNQIAYFVPCHRIIPKHGKDVGQYRWGRTLKQELLNSEKELCKNIDSTT
jgi:O-6-methylguanine DNA methyltransferase